MGTEELAREVLALRGNPRAAAAAVFALLILSESMTLVQVGGGALIGAGIVLARRRAASVPQSE